MSERLVPEFHFVLKSIPGKRNIDEKALQSPRSV